MAATEVPYLVHDGGPTAKHLVVGFPKLHPGAVLPSSRFLKRNAHLNAHLLALGADEHVFIGPRRQRLGLRVAVRLIRAEAKRLGVARENVIAVGTSMGAICALTIGAYAGCGRIIAGGPPIRMGKWLKHFAEVDGPTIAAKSAAAQFLALADNGDGAPERYLDRFPVLAAVRAPDPTAIEIFVSENDFTYRGARWYVKRLEKQSGLDAQLVVADYGRHADIKEPFDAYVEERLVALCGIAEPSRAVR